MRLVLLLAASAVAVSAQYPFPGPVTGQPVPSMALLDFTMEKLLTTYQIPGGALAVSNKGALIYARGFGYADTARSTPVQPDSLFRTASVSKTFTAAVVLKLIEEGQPILHRNGYKISNPTVLARIEHEELEQFLRGCGWTPHFVEGDDPETMHQLMAATMETAIENIRQIQENARKNSDTTRARWPRWPKGWTGPKVVDELGGF
jgi:predicted component of type VI protein secretion system